MMLQKYIFALITGALLASVALPAHATDQRVEGAQITEDEVADIPSITVTAKEEKYEEDPAEDFNRGMYEFNDTIDGVLIEPVTKGYRTLLSPWTRQRVDNVLDTMRAPNQFINSALQGDVDAVFTSFWRFFVNATFGLGGMFDVASDVGLKPVNKDFGQTLHKYGFGEGEYLVAPVIGSTNPRDIVGLVFDSLTNPFNALGYPFLVTKTSATVVSKRDQLYEVINDIKDNSFDPYAKMRVMARQNRDEEIEKVAPVSAEDSERLKHVYPQ